MKYSYLLLPIIILLTHFSSGYAQSPVEEIIKILNDSESDQVLVAAHRGDWHNYPENSLEGVISAVNMGVDIIEIDIQMTKDGHLVLMHDKTIDRVTSSKGFVKDFTLDSLKKLGLKNGLDRVTRFRIPTLEEVMIAVKGKVLVNLDKGYDYIKQSYTVLEKTGSTNQVITKSDHPLEKVISDNNEKVLRTMNYMPVINIDKAGAAQAIAEFQDKFKPSGFELNFGSESSDVLNSFATIRKKGARVWVNSLWPTLNAGHDDDRAATGDLTGSYDWILAKGATIIQTDRPELLLLELRKKKLHK